MMKFELLEYLYNNSTPDSYAPLNDFLKSITNTALQDKKEMLKEMNKNQLIQIEGDLWRLNSTDAGVLQDLNIINIRGKIRENGRLLIKEHLDKKQQESEKAELNRLTKENLILEKKVLEFQIKENRRKVIYAALGAIGLKLFEVIFDYFKNKI